jgi:hypothetical protein
MDEKSLTVHRVAQLRHHNGHVSGDLRIVAIQRDERLFDVPEECM